MRSSLARLAFLTLGLGSLGAGVACSAREPEDGSARPDEAAARPHPSAAPVEPPSAAPSPEAGAASDAPPVAPEGPKDDGPRVYAKSRFVWIMPQPGASQNSWTGFMWFGESVKLKRAEPILGPGCAAWYEVEPRGFVCVDGERATLDPNDPVFAAVRPFMARIDSPWPHEYGESRGVERYRELPPAELQRKREWDLEDHLKKLEAARAGTLDPSLAGISLEPVPSRAPIALPKLPPTFYENRTRLRPLSTVAWIAERNQDGRDWLLGADLMWMPKDRVAPYEKVTFHGVRLGKDASLPLAFFRVKARPKYQLDGESVVATGETWARLSYVELTSRTLTRDGKTYLETKDDGRYLDQDDAVVPTPAERTPWGAPVGGVDETAIAPTGRQTWLETSVYGGWLIAYEGTKPVYVTLIAPGRGGIPRPGIPAIDTAATPTGTFKITGKFITASMVAPYEFIHSDVPWTQNFSGPHALHGAYWHDRWGEPMSGGCVNVSPIDGKWLFEFTEPDLPEGWHGMRWEPKLSPATTFVVHR
ncbi:MAG: L,D-transpeptidase family protein [Sorangiineae bacterium]|nr:L,D-transpeptidase family protein [Polyangiaceae bacterium]MEB2323664.1 L,D-transpeptidase family protein [Sorangiineae bacterium]